MVRTTPPRPFDVDDVIPGLREYRAGATRLHPRAGAPGVADSSIGGPLLWPADEPWPVCDAGDDHEVDTLLAPATVRRSREIRAAAAGRSFTAAELAELPGIRFSEPEELARQSIPMIPVAQLYRRDVPGFLGPDDTDLFQVLWCPLFHAEDMTPRIRVLWRRTADVGEPLTAAPEPPVVEEDHLPNPCAVHPERVSDYPYREILPEPLRARIAAWEAQTGGPGYRAWSVVPGWKVGGHPSWRMTGPGTMHCRTCGTEMRLLFTVGFGEWDEAGWWRPIEEPAGDTDPMTEVVINRGFDWYLFHCPASFDHPIDTVMQ
ncbi:hypothetical protein [Actinoplanes couchii]|uniref:DUF1963 domain-containing protein n=1 Tax=Actinoplanes couchii TaxID=403638 RepID=A0ABQ3XQM9_9ACTN|nr:hypothetical protein [Actinoplanes couchii]MDR6318789.1 hypothetical protein [Actinoplanes couchii]GID60820.1 hypothetical protein Aco03nite_092240 [Actinoplanes couchii]